VREFGTAKPADQQFPGVAGRGDDLGVPTATRIVEGVTIGSAFFAEI
jgi:hypothetical protein